MCDGQTGGCVMYLEIIVSSLSGIIGAAVGGYATYKTMEKQLSFQNEQDEKKRKIEEETYLKHKREEAYLSFIRFYSDWFLGRELKQYDTEKLAKTYSEFKPSLLLYGSKGVIKMIKVFDEIIIKNTDTNEIIRNFDVLLDYIRNELKIPEE